MSDNFFIGSTKLDGFTYTKNKWFHLEPGENYYRILPPVHSLAKLGRFSQFYAFHSGFKNSKGSICMFQCIEEVDRDTKMITRHCPVCDMVRERRSQYELAKKQPNVTKEQLDKFFYQFLRPFEVQKKFFVNAVNMNNEIGVLSLPCKLHSTLKVFLKDKIDKGFDPTSGEGSFLKLTKSQQYKGDRDTNYSVDLAFESDPANPENFRIKKHNITPDFVNLMKTQTRDLSSLYKALASEDLATLVETPLEQQPLVMDRFFGKPEQPEVKDEDLLTSNIPNTTAKAVHRVDLTPDGMKVSTPKIQPLAEETLSYATTQTVTAPAAAPAAFKPAAPVAPVASTEMSDADFMARFMPTK